MLTANLVFASSERARDEFRAPGHDAASVMPISIDGGEFQDILAAGGTPVIVPERNLTADVDAILARVTERTKIVFLANPNNPTGTYLPFEEVRRLHAGLPPHVLLVLDAAYAEYVRRNDYSSGLELVATSDNVVMTRTFSKIYGLALLRLGWCYAPAHVADALNRIRFELRLGSHPDRALQAEWRDGGEARFSFEVLALVKERSEAGFDYGAELRLLEELHRGEHAREGGAP